MPILTHKCPHCLTDHIALEVISVTGIAEWRAALYLRCPKCNFPCCAHIFAVHGRNKDPLRWNELEKQGGDITTYHWVIDELWPEAPGPLVPEYMPPNVSRIYLQAERNFSVTGNEEAAGMMYRKALDIALGQVDPSLTGMLGQKIKKLAANGRLTEDIAEWSDNIRDLGNEAAHEADAPTREELEALRNFSEMVLRYLFSLPGLVKKRKGERLEWETAEDSG